MDQNTKPKAVVLMSGGMDSCVTAAIAHKTCKSRLASYGHRKDASSSRFTRLPIILACRSDWRWC
jgi:7-cyano-7-deazaguanine synthase in queuosine biosynthesis